MRAKLRMSPPSAMVIASGFEDLCSAAKIRFGMHVAILAGRGAAERLGVPRRAPHVLAPERLGPRLVDIRRGPRCLAERRERERRVWRRAPLRRAGSRAAPPSCRAMRTKRAFGKHRRRAVAQLVVELAADDDDQIRLLHRPGAHGADHRRVVSRNEAAALLRVEIDRAGGVEEAQRAPRPRPIAPRPVITSGRFAAAMIAAARSTSAGSGGMHRGGFGREILAQDQLRLRPSRRSTSVGIST